MSSRVARKEERERGRLAAQEAAAELIAQGAKKNEVKRAAIAVKAWISQLTQEEE